MLWTKVAETFWQEGGTAEVPIGYWDYIETPANGHEEDTQLFYWTKHVGKGWTRGWFTRDALHIREYVTYKAMTWQEYTLWEDNKPVPSSSLGGSTITKLPGHSRRQADGSRTRGDVIENLPGDRSAIGVFVESFSKWDRIASKISQDRDAMNAIARGVPIKGSPLNMTQLVGGGMKVDIVAALEKAGYSKEQIDWYFDPTEEPLGMNLGLDRAEKTGEVSASPSPPAPKLTPPTPAVTKLVVRAPIGYTKPAGRGEDQRPHMVQVGSMLDEPDRYFFRHIPNQVSYQGLGSRWVEIPRKGDFPIVEWSDWALMKVQFDFLIASELDGEPGRGDGLFNSVDEDIEQLRRMAQRPLPVSIFGMDQLFSMQMRRAQEGKNMQFVIANFTVKSARRTVNEGNKEITAAQCSMTLQEIPIETMKVVEMGMPILTGPTVPAPNADDEVPSDPLWTDQNPEVRSWKQRDATGLQTTPVTTATFPPV
jgi:hypothetical protein